MSKATGLGVLRSRPADPAASADAEVVTQLRDNGARGPAFDADTSDDTSSRLSPRMPFNVVGAPAIAVPISVTANGLPLSMQLVGARGADYQLLALAHACEQALGGRVQRLTARRS